jgi:hypothetical protein
VGVSAAFLEGKVWNSGFRWPKPARFWVGWRKRWPNGKPRSSSRKGGAVPIVAGSARAKGTTESCFVPRLACGRQGPQSSNPLAELLAERTSPELAYLETKFAALVSYGLTIKLLEEVLPIGQDLRGCLKGPANSNFTESAIGFTPAVRKLE